MPLTPKFEFVEITTSKYSGGYRWKNYLSENNSGITYKLLDSNGDEITSSQNEVNAVKTMVYLEPPFNYMISEGGVYQRSMPSTNIYCSAVLLPRVQGYTREVLSGINLYLLDRPFTFDPEVSSYLEYNSQVHTNEILLVNEHNPGVQHTYQFWFLFQKE